MAPPCGCRSSSGCGTNARFLMSMRFAHRSTPIAGARGGSSAVFRCRIFSMSQAPDRAPDGMLLRLSVPAGGDLRAIAVDVAKRVAEYLRDRAPDSAAVAAAVDNVASRVAPAASDAEI